MIGGFELPGMAAWRVEMCYAEFQEHCVKTHGLLETDNAQMYFDLKVGTLTLLLRGTIFTRSGDLDLIS